MEANFQYNKHGEKCKVFNRHETIPIQELMTPKWPFSKGKTTPDPKEQQPTLMTDSTGKNPNPALTFEGKRYDLNSLPDELKELVRGMQVADAQLRMHEDTLKVLALGRQTLAMQLNEKLKNVHPLPDAS